MTITAFLEAAKKATAGPYAQGRTLETYQTAKWSDEQRRANDEIERVHVFANFTWRDQGRSRQLVATAERPEDAEFIAAARNAAKEIEELRDWVRDKAAHSYPCYAGTKEYHGEREVVHECTCGLDRIREIVGR